MVAAAGQRVLMRPSPYGAVSSSGQPLPSSGSPILLQTNAPVAEAVTDRPRTVAHDAPARAEIAGHERPRELPITLPTESWEQRNQQALQLQPQWQPQLPVVLEPAKVAGQKAAAGIHTTPSTVAGQKAAAGIHTAPSTVAGQKAAAGIHTTPSTPRRRASSKRGRDGDVSQQDTLPVSQHGCSVPRTPAGRSQRRKRV